MSDKSHLEFFFFNNPKISFNIIQNSRYHKYITASTHYTVTRVPVHPLHTYKLKQDSPWRRYQIPWLQGNPELIEQEREKPSGGLDIERKLKPWSADFQPFTLQPRSPVTALLHTEVAQSSGFLASFFR